MTRKLFWMPALVGIGSVAIIIFLGCSPALAWVTDGQVPEAAPETAAIGYEQETPVSTAQGFGQQSLFSGATSAGYLYRAAQRYGSDMAAENRGEQKLSPDDVDKNYGPIGPDGKQVPISGGQSMYPETAQLIAKAKGDELDRQGIISRFQNQHGLATNFAVGAAAFMSDPLNALFILAVIAFYFSILAPLFKKTGAVDR